MIRVARTATPLRRWWAAGVGRRDGQALVEYALILALIAVVAILAVQALGNHATNTLNTVANSL